MKRALRKHAIKLVVVATCAVAAVAAQLPEPAVMSDQTVPSRFTFGGDPLTAVATHGTQTTRSVATDYRRIGGWLSAVGAAVAIADIDGNGREDDYCLVDPRTDTITVGPAPTTTPRYKPFALTATSLPFDTTKMAPMGCLPADLNADGHLDLLAYYWGRSPIAFLSTGEDMKYAEQEVVPAVEDWATDSVLATDVDGDGKLDLVVGNYYPDGSGLLSSDGRASETMAMHDSMSDAQNGGGARILLLDRATGGSKPSVRYTEAKGSLPEPSTNRWTLAIASQDLTGDARPELFLSNDFGPDQLLLNRSSPGHVDLRRVLGQPKFNMPRSKVLGRDSFKGMGIDFADMNADGRTDMFVSNLSSRLNLLESNHAFVSTGDEEAQMSAGIAPFRDAADSLGLSHTGWGWDVKFGDFDNDTNPELLQAAGFMKGQKSQWPQLQELALANDLVEEHVGLWPRFTPDADISGDEKNHFWVLGSDGRWGDVAEQLGLQQQVPSRGFATADINGDGKLDFAVANQWGASNLYVNACTTCGEALQLDLRRPTESGNETTPAYGAAVRVQLPNGRTLIQQVDSGSGHASARGNHLHLGLGQEPPDAAVPVEVTWRDVHGQVHTRVYKLRPGSHHITLAPENNR